MNSEHVDAAVAASATKATVAGVSVTTLGSIFNANAAVAVGIVVTILGFLVNVIFQWRRDRRERREFEARMAERGLYE